MGKKITGIATLTSVILTIVLSLLTVSRGEFFSAINIQLLIVLFTLSVSFGGMYLLNAESPHTGKNTKLSIMGLGIILPLFSIVVAFNIADFLATYNWLIAFGLLYILLVQLQILR